MTTLPQNFQFIGGYDNRFGTSTIASSDAHKMATRTTKPRAPKTRTLDQILDRALTMKVKVEMSSKQFTLYPPKFDANGDFVGHNYGEYYTTTKANAWRTLDTIQIDILAATSDVNIASQASAARELISAF